MQESTELENIDEVIAYAKSLPDFPNKAIIVQRLETRNLNRYQEALLNLHEILAQPEVPLPASEGEAITCAQLEALRDKISGLEANEPVAE
jgi:hypothetical protein